MTQEANLELGNLPFRQLCVSLGAELTYSEMAVSASIMQGKKPEWALMKAHRSEAEPPRISDPYLRRLLAGSDARFGVQIAASKPLMAWQATEVITDLCPRIRVVDLNCGCPIDLIYQSGGGSALLASPAKMRRMLQGMNAVSGEVPISVKLRIGVADAKPMADKIISKLLEPSDDTLHHLGASTGVAAITLHGRSRQQRYTKAADWSYIASCSAAIQEYRRQEDELRDTTREVDDRLLPPQREPYFIGNGDVYSHVDYQDHIEQSGVDSVMVARGALVKPWIFEEIATGQYLDKSANERLDYIRTFARNGLTYWGTDEMGLQNTRRFLLEWLSFAYRYVPIGLLERLPPRLQDRPPRYKGRNELETLMASPDSNDWVKITEMVLGKCGEGFNFIPKHKSNSYEADAEG